MPVFVLRWLDRLEHPRALGVAFLLLIVLSLPMLWAGLLLDDYLQAIVLQTDRGNVFDFFSRGTPLTEQLFQQGLLPWWTPADQQIRFYRPGAQALMAVDAALWPQSWALMHLHSWLWYVALIGVFALAAHQLRLPRAGVILAMMLFAFDSTHAGAVTWLANRNALLSLICGLLVMCCYARGGLRFHLLGGLLWFTGLLFSEALLATAGFLFAYEVFLRHDAVWRRARRLLPYALISVCWIVYWVQGGYGTQGPGFYLNPFSQSEAFLAALPHRVMAFLVGWFALPSADVLGALLVADHTVGVTMWTSLVLVGLAALFWPLLKSDPRARFLLLGTVIAAIPISSGWVVSRSLWWISAGGALLLVLLVQAARRGGADWGRWRQRGVMALLVIHVPLSLMMFPVYAASVRWLDQQMVAPGMAFDFHKGSSVLIVTVPSQGNHVLFPGLKAYWAHLSAYQSEPDWPVGALQTLMEGEGPVRLIRLHEDSLRVEALPEAPDRLASMMPSPVRWSVGQRFQQADMTVTVEALTDGQPTQLRYDFVPGQLAQKRILIWQGSLFVPTVLPAPGRARVLRP